MSDHVYAKQRLESQSEIVNLAGRYVSYVLEKEPSGGGALAKAERAYILWDWEGLAALAYEQCLKQGRGAFIGPRTIETADSITVAFDYVGNVNGSIAKILGQDLATALCPHIDHYHPEFDFIVVWLRKDGTARYEVLQANEQLGLRRPRDLYELTASESRARPN